MPYPTPQLDLQANGMDEQPHVAKSYNSASRNELQQSS
jgi:hypothetical protein